MLLLAELVLFRVKSLVCGVHWVAGIHSPHVLIIYLLFILLLLLAWLVPRQLSEELLGARDGRVHLVVLGRNEEAGQSLQHDQALLHVLSIASLLLREEIIQDVDRVVESALRQPQILCHFAQPVDDKAADFPVLRRYLQMLLLFLLPELTL